MSVTAITTLITDAGLAAAINAADQGLKLNLTHIAVGDGQVEPTTASTALSNELERIEILSGAAVDPATLVVSGVLQSATTYRIHEIGIIAEDGTLVAVGYRELGIVEKAAGIEYPIQFSMPLTALPTDSVTATAELNLDLAFLGPIASLTASVADMQRRAIDREIKTRVALNLPTLGMEKLV